MINEKKLIEDFKESIKKYDDVSGNTPGCYGRSDRVHR